jgi:hypothetical protein
VGGHSGGPRLALDRLQPEPVSDRASETGDWRLGVAVQRRNESRGDAEAAREAAGLLGALQMAAWHCSRCLVLFLGDSVPVPVPAAVSCPCRCL